MFAVLALAVTALSAGTEGEEPITVGEFAFQLTTALRLETAPEPLATGT